MKSACFIVGEISPNPNAVERFLRSEYGFCEVRKFLPSVSDGEIISQTSGYSAVAVFCRAARLNDLKTAAMQSFQSTASERLWVSEQTSLFLLPIEDTTSSVVMEDCLSALDERQGRRRIRKIVRFVHSDSAFVNRLVEAVKSRFGQGVYVDYCEKADDYAIQISAENEFLADEALRSIVVALGDSVYALEDTSLAERLVELLRLRGVKIGVAESFTGGAVGRKIVSVPGASQVYFEGLNTYSNRAKTLRLGVSDVTLGAHGAASDKTAYEMCLGVLSSGECDLAVATTGVAGPTPESVDKPVGLCFVSVGTRERVYVYRFEFTGTREEIAEKGVSHALLLACRRLKEF